MGRGRGRKRDFSGGGGGGRDGPKRQRKDGKGWLEEGDYDNADFQEYYKEQGIVPEGEWDEFMACLRRPLPVTFRINGGGRFADHLRDKMTSDFFSHFREGGDAMDFNEEGFEPPRPLPWYPNNYAWHMAFTRQQLRKTPLLEEVHEFMKKANQHGSISRQEAVSMVPPLFLDVQPHHAVLDMCAAPGSKTQQLLEALHAGDTFPTGFVVANDADFKRCNLLTHQTKRVCSPCLLVTNHSAEMFPEVKMAGPDGADVPLRFDRILADVPCSGDGTMRKAPDIWRRWGVGGGNGLHLLQLRIALQGCKLLKVGGRLVYSTCTFNPIEDEAVVSELLMLCQGGMELVDVSGEIPELRRLPGKTSWKVKDKFRWYSSWEDAQDGSMKLDPSMFPSDAKAKLPMHRCMRFLPHHQDTGGFFVCVLRKAKELPHVEMPNIKDRMGRDTPTPRPKVAPPAAAGSVDAADVGDDANAGADTGGADSDGGDDVGDAKGHAEQAAPEAQQGEPAAAASEAPAEKERMTPLEVASSAAQQSIDAAEAAIDALARGDARGVATAHSDATRAAARAGFALDMHGKAQRAMEKQGRMGKGKPGGDAEQTGGEGDGDEAAAGTSGAAAAGVATKPSWVRGGGGRNRSGGGRHSHIDPIIPVEERALLDPLREYYHLGKDFPLYEQLIARSMETNRPKRLYFVCKPLMDIMLRDKREQLKITATGLKVFERQDIKDVTDCNCQYRLAQEGLPFMMPFVSKQRITLTKEDFLSLLRDRCLMLPDAQVLEAEAKEDGKAPRKRTVITNKELLDGLANVRPGCTVAELDTADATALGFAAGNESVSLTANAPMALSAWKGKASLAIMVDKNECLWMVDKITAAMGKA